MFEKLILISHSVGRKKCLKWEMFICLAIIGNEIYIDQTLEIFASVVWKVMLIQTSNESCVITDSFDDFATASFELSFFWFFKA